MLLSRFATNPTVGGLRGEKEKCYTWGRLLGSFFKLLEVGVSPYLSFILILSVLRMFESKEAIRGRLIGPKTWDRIIGKFLETFRGRFCTVRG